MDVSCGFRPLYCKVGNYCKKIARAEGGKAVCRKWAMELESDLGNLRAPSPGFTELAGTDLACQSSLLWAEIAEQESH